MYGQNYRQHLAAPWAESQNWVPLHSAVLLEWQNRATHCHHIKLLPSCAVQCFAVCTPGLSSPSILGLHILAVSFETKLWSMTTTIRDQMLIPDWVGEVQWTTNIFLACQNSQCLSFDLTVLLHQCHLLVLLCLLMFGQPVRNHQRCVEKCWHDWPVKLVCVHCWHWQFVRTRMTMIVPLKNRHFELMQKIETLGWA